MNWYIGQRVVAIESHSQGAFKKGDEFEVFGVDEFTCKCGIHRVLLDIGKTPPTGKYSGCTRCGSMFSYETAWYSSKMFAPLESRPELSEITAEELIKELETQKVKI